MTAQTKTAVPQSKPRTRQRKAAVAVVKNAQLKHPKPIGQVLESVGYGEGLQHNPNRVLESAGFKAAMAELGLTEDLIASSLVTDIKKKKGKRYHELKLGAEILGMVKRAPETPPAPPGATYNFIFAGETQAAVKAINDQIKARLLQKK